ncbi:MAG TPA: DUF998 domain-containing protein [Glaciibacter sp.]|nr:DUF998 domain-containing protein [Glaciibacter sp.]
MTVQITATSTRKTLATVAIAGVLLYVLVDIALQLLPPHYDPIREAESNLAVGPFGWIMNLNFLARAITTLCAVGAIHLVGRPSRLRFAGLILLLFGGAASAVIAFYPIDVDVAQPYTVAGAVHIFVATAGFLAALFGVTLVTLWLWLTRLLGTTILATVFAALAAVGGLWLAVATTATDTIAPETLGLSERLCLVGILGWTFVVCAGIRLLPPSPPA